MRSFPHTAIAVTLLLGLNACAQQTASSSQMSPGAPGTSVSTLDGTYTGPGKVPPAYDCGSNVPPIFHAEMKLTGTQFTLKPWPEAQPITGELLPDGTLRNRRGKLGTLKDGRATGYVSYGPRCRTTFELTKD